MELNYLTRIRSVDVVGLAETGNFGLNDEAAYSWANGAFVVIGLYEDWNLNEVCATVELSSIYDCDLNGRYLSLVLEYQNVSPLCFTEISAYSTINIAPYAEVFFSGNSDYDPRLVVDGPIISTCEDQDNFPCFQASSDGIILIDFT